MTGCEWKKVFGHDCSDTKNVELDIKKYSPKNTETKKIKVLKIATRKKIKEEENFIRKITEPSKNNYTKKTKMKYVPAEDTKPFYTRRRKKGRVVKEEIKYTEIKPLINNPVVVKKEKEIDFTKIKTESQDDWIKKIKTI